MRRRARGENAMKLQDQSLFRQQCYIDGAWADADSGDTIDVTDPATNEVLEDWADEYKSQSR